MYNCQHCNLEKHYDLFHKKPKFIKGKRICIECYDIRVESKKPKNKRPSLKNCINCEKKLVGRQLRYCSSECKVNHRKVCKPCVECGEDASSKFCSEKCRLDSRKKEVVEKTCFCGKLFSTNNPNHKYCSKACRTSVNKKPVNNRCIHCSKYSNGKKYCSRSCSSKYLRSKLPKIVVAKYSHTCEICQKEYINRSETSRFCSKQCSRKDPVNRERENIARKKWYKENKDRPEVKATRRKHSKIGRVVRKKRVKERTLLGLFNKDTVMFYENRPSDVHIDHIVPLKSELVSGLHVSWNLQYLSPEENILKSNKFDGTYDNTSWKSD